MAIPMPTLDALMKEVRDQASAALAAATPPIAVNKEFIYTGEPPHDECGQLAVYLDNMNQTQTNPLGGLQGSRALNRFVQIITTDLIVEFTACAPAFGPGNTDPTAQDYEDAHSEAARSIHVIYQYFSDHVRDGDLLAALAPELGPQNAPSNIRLGLVEPGGVSGGVAWYRFTVTITYP